MVNNQPAAHARRWPPRVVMAATQGQSGKTLISIGLCVALTEQGLSVQPFKKGPDYIDPSWLSAAAHRNCRNLDGFLLPEGTLLASFESACQGADLALVEGAMGLYDGLDIEGRWSTAGLSRILDAPIILIVNTARMTRSVAAMITGYQRFEPDTNIAGVILNNVAGSRHESKLVSAVERYCGIPVIGAIPRDHSLNITQRHLGLVPCREAERAESIIEHIGDVMKEHLDLDAFLATARKSKARGTSLAQQPPPKEPCVRIGVILDNVFTFYYQENLEALRQAGAELVLINSIQDRKLPDIDGLYINGGFPEMFVEELEANTNLRHDIASAARNGLPIYAECAGLMYLCQSIRWHQQRHEMVGAIPAEVEMCPRPQGHGYVEVEVINNNSFFPAGFKMRGHQFHYSRIMDTRGLKFAYQVRDSRGGINQPDGIVYNNMLASYTHLHALGVPQWAEAFVLMALQKKVPSPL